MGTPEFENLGSLITIRGTDQCLGYLMEISGKGVYEPSLGKVDITSEHVFAHNEALDRALLKGLDETCEIGQSGFFYYHLGTKTVRTFLGTLVSDQIRRNGKSLTMSRANKVYRGVIRKNSELISLKRIA